MSRLNELASVFFAALVVLAACDDGAPPPPDAGFDGGVDAGPPPGMALCPADAGRGPTPPGGLTNECTDALVLSGFALRFDTGARPLARYAVYPRLGGDDLSACEASATFRTATIVGSLAGGTTPAVGHLGARYAVVGVGMDRDRPDGGAPVPAIRMVRETLSMRLDAGNVELTVPRRFDLLSAGLAGSPSIAVILDGVELDTDLPQGIDFPASIDPAEGFELARFGVSIGAITRVGDEIGFDLTARYAAGHDGSMVHDMAVDTLSVDVTVRYAVVAVPIDPVYAQASYRWQNVPVGTEPASVCRPGADVGEVTLSGSPAPHALAALTSFDFALFPDESDRRGIDVRELSVLIDGFDYDPVSGAATLTLEGYLTNEGDPVPERAVDYAFSGEVVLLSWDGEGDVRTLRLDADVSAGSAEAGVVLTP
ncbi:MAG: hypothetical protein AB7S26_12375 [Sandaracinaceae bacterium]